VHGALISVILNLLAGREPAALPGTQGFRGLVEPLSQAETRVLRYLPTSLSVPEIADQLYVSVNTVRTHTRHIYDKLGAHRRQEVVDAARALGLLAPAGRILRPGSTA
jgi:LuxR family transcriptional regulator, maltose regulon positive regulatory protein